jgi:N-methylhydantoinase A
MITIDIDTGGTFTDGFFTKEGEIITAKVLTTPHDLTVCMADCIKDAAKQFGISLQEILLNADVVKYSSTIGINTLITRQGTKVGLVVTKGFGESLYAQEQGKPEQLLDIISNEMIVELEEEIDNEGNEVKPLNKVQVLEKIQYLIDMGAGAIAVSLRNSHLNPSHEKQAKRLIKEQYPSFYLGSVRVFLGSEVSDQPGDFERTNGVVVNGYIHDSLVKYLYKAEDDLRANLYQHPLMVSNSHGGVARVAKTRAIDTISSGPALGLIGAGELGKMYGLSNVVTVDMGGTSLDLGLIQNGVYPYSMTPEISEITVSVPMISTYSLPLASGSIANVDVSGKIKIGPQSAGASPGPACFDLGGMAPTVTDADVVLGFIDPDYFLGGKFKLNKERAVSAIQSKIAEPMKINFEEAALLIKETAEAQVQYEILNFLKLKSIDDSDRPNMALIAYGGAGPTHCCGFLKGLSFGLNLTSSFSSVFSAFGSSRTDLVHSYVKSVKIPLVDDGRYLDDFNQFNEVVKEGIRLAGRDVQSEGYSPEEANYYLDLTGTGDSMGVRVTVHQLYMESQDDLQRVCQAFRDMGSPNGQKIVIGTIVLNALIKMPRHELKKQKPSGKDPGHALKTNREILWSSEIGYKKTPIYDSALLIAGNVVEGPAVVEAKDTNYVIPINWSFLVDEYANVVIKEGT